MKFNQVEELEVGDFVAEVSNTLRFPLVFLGSREHSYGIPVDTARKLHEWLGRALPAQETRVHPFFVEEGEPAKGPLPSADLLKPRDCDCTGQTGCVQQEGRTCVITSLTERD